MTVLSFSELPHILRSDGVEMTNFFGGEMPAGEGVTMGYAVFPPGAQAPEAAHEADEYSYILSGTVKTYLPKEGETLVCSPGSASFIPAGQVHASFNDGDEPCHVVWVLVEKK